MNSKKPSRWSDKQRHKTPVLNSFSAMFIINKIPAFPDNCQYQYTLLCREELYPSWGSFNRLAFIIVLTPHVAVKLLTAIPYLNVFTLTHIVW